MAASTLLVACALLAGAIAVRGADDGPNTKTIVTSPPTPTTTSAPASSHRALEPLPAPALSRRDGAAFVWTGKGLAVWGGNIDAANSGLSGPDRSYNDGAVYSIETRRWTPMAPSPLRATAESPVGVPTDDGVVFARGRETALWNPESDTWSKLADAPKPVYDMTFIGSAVFSYSANATLDVAAGTWSALPEPPLQLDRKATAWTGHDIIAIGGNGTPFASAVAIALDPATREWRRIADLPPDVHAEALSAAWDGRRLVAANYDMRAVAYDPASDAWSTLPAMPARFYEWYPSVYSAGGYTLVFMSQAVVILTPAGTWVPLPYGEFPYGRIATTQPGFVAQPTDEGVIFVLGRNREIENATPLVVRADLAQLVATASRLQVGIASVQLPPGYRLRASHYGGPENDFTSGSVVIELTGPNGAPCSVTSTYTGMAGSPDKGTLTRESLRNDGAPHTWYRNAPGTVWNADVTTSDTFVIECSDAKAARALAGSTSYELGG